MADRDEVRARAYDSAYPGVQIPDAQKAERQERQEFKHERLSLRRTNRTRGIVVPDLPLDEHGRLRP